MKKLSIGVQLWDITKSEDDDYEMGERVLYVSETKNIEAVYYKTGTTSDISPEHTGAGWTMDTDYIVPWRSSTTYVRNQSAVSYRVGNQTYYYKASQNYFGGGDPPNEELDDDGIRTWELYVEYVEEQVTRLIPFRKKFGVFFQYDDDWQKRPVIGDVEDFLARDVIMAGGLTDKMWDSERKFQQFTSKCESDPYNENVYKFTDDKTNLDGSEIHLRKGIHKAQWYKKTQVNNASQRELAIWADRQKYFTQGVGALYPHGVSLEMWPAEATDSYELIPFAHLNTEYPVPALTVGFPSEGLRLLGEEQLPDGIPSSWTETTAEGCKLDLGVTWNHVTFQERSLTLVFHIAFSTKTYYFKDEVWNVKYIPETYEVTEKQINTNESSYSTTIPWIIPKSKNFLDFSGYKRVNTETYIYLTGYRIH